MMLLEAGVTNTMGKSRLAVFLDVNLNLFPVAAVIANLFAVGANWQQPAQGLDFLQGCLQFR
jgi:hypothetical protein